MTDYDLGCVVRPAVLAVASTLLVACASTHDLGKSAGALGGGIQRQEVRPGFYLVEAQTNFAPWSNFAGAERLWRHAAEAACGSDRYQELGIRQAVVETARPALGILRYVVTSRKGYALCATSTLTRAEAAKIAEKN